MILYNKLFDIDKHGHQTIMGSMKPVFRFKKNQRDVFVKNEVKKVAQENLFILKRLLSKESEYSSIRFEKEYQRLQKYKRNICHYPDVNFLTSPNKDAPLVQGYNFNKNGKKIKKVKLPKIGGKTIRSAYKDFRATHRTLDEKYYKEAKRSMNSTTRSKFKITKYSPQKKGKDVSNIDEASNEGSSSGKGDENSVSGSRDGSGDGSGSGSGSGDGSGSGEGSGDGSGSGSGSGNGTGSGDAN